MPDLSSADAFITCDHETFHFYLTYTYATPSPPRPPPFHFRTIFPCHFRLKILVDTVSVLLNAVLDLIISAHGVGFQTDKTIRSGSVAVKREREDKDVVLTLDIHWI